MQVRIGIDPVIGHLGSLEIRWYGIFIASGILAGTVVAAASRAA